MTILVAVVFDKMYFSKEIDSCHAVIVATTDYFFLLQIGERVLDPTCQQEITCPANNNGNIVIQAFNCPTAGECLIDQFQQVCQCSTQQVLFEGSCLDNPCLPNPCTNLGRCVIDDLLTGTFYCVCNPMSTGPSCSSVARQCSVYGDPHFRTFDSENYEFLAENCEYFLVRNTAVFANDARITITTEPSVVSTITQVNSVTISEAGNTVEFVLSNTGITVLVNNLLVTPPSAASDIGQIYNAGFNSYVTFVSFALGYEVRVSPQRAVDVKYPTIGNTLSGLCGNADNIPTLNSANQVGINTFGDTQRVPICFNPPSNGPNACIPLNDGLCSLLLVTNTASALATCFSTVNPSPFYQDCRTDLCRSVDASKPCAVIATYAQWCRDNSITIPNWRENTNCVINCPMNSFFDINAPANPPSCANPNPTQINDPLPNVEACTCVNGFLLEGTQCIPAADCGCTFNGFYFARNQVYSSNDCSTRCLCPATGVFDILADYGFSCFLPGCGIDTCSNNGVCQTRITSVNPPDNPDFFCVCPPGFVGQNCSQQVWYVSILCTTQTFLSRNSLNPMTSPGYPDAAYPRNDRRFRQFYCSGSTYIQLTVNEFVTETERDFLFVGVGFPEQPLDQLLPIARDPGRPLPPGVQAFSGVKGFPEPLLFATDAMWFYFVTDNAFSVNGFSIDVNCMTGPVPDGTVNNCFDGVGLKTIPDQAPFVISSCETCICNSGQIICQVTDQTALDNTLNNQAELVRGRSCTDDTDCAALAGSMCLLPTCLGASCPGITNRVCSSGDSLEFCSFDILCRQVDLNFNENSVIQTDIVSLCSDVRLVLEQSLAPCLIIECVIRDQLNQGKRAAEDIPGVEVRVAAKSHVKSQEELEEAIKQLDDLFPQISAEIMAKFSYVSEVEYVRGENDRISVERPPGPDVNVVETENTDVGSSPWTYLLTALVVILMVVAIGLTITIYTYYKRQTNSLNAKFDPASPSYPTDNLPESLEMVKAEDRDKDSIFARRVPLDDSTGNKDNVFSLSWSRDEQENKSKKDKKGQSNC
ncbi:putative IgGFc-binding protein [Apostichopus japonicus]|uniref:Putative IgGFc-binding protein n=1 Tax=Stichopus japonicus TaxID=307972 RepID=A0A2G8L8E2_STIJA|nr:putative IgGFc-binding protein [Apostichopus japonicus]